MDTVDSLEIDFDTHERVQQLRDVVRYALEEISLGFDNWDERGARGPGMYVAIVATPSVASFADPMGDNHWPETECREPLEDQTGFVEAATRVAYSRDGAVVLSVDGVVNQQMVRFRSLDTTSHLEYAPWMGSRHMSALDISTHEDVVCTLTLSQEDGRVTTFVDGAYEAVPREALGGRWRS